MKGGLLYLKLVLTSWIPLKDLRNLQRYMDYTFRTAGLYYSIFSKVYFETKATSRGTKELELELKGRLLHMSDWSKEIRELKQSATLTILFLLMELGLTLCRRVQRQNMKQLLTGILRYMREPCCPMTRHHASAHRGPQYPQGYLEYQELEPLMQTSTFSGQVLPDAVVRCPHGVWREMGIWKASEQHMAYHTFTPSCVAPPGIFISNSMRNCR